MKLTFLALLIFLSACTYTPKLKYEAYTTDGSQFSEADLDKIDKGLIEKQKKERVEGDSRSYYLNKSYLHWDILTIKKIKTGLSLSVDRLSKYLTGFSEEWKVQFTKGTTK